MIEQLVVNISEQTIQAYSGDTVVASYAVSTALNGPGELNGSGCTPRGKHIVRAKIGAGLPEGAVLKARRWTGEVCTEALYSSEPERDWILSRVLWLSGCEHGKNRLGKVDTFRRYIYIHGTPEAEPMGVPLSHGCIRMRNQELITLFDQINVGCPVLIKE